MPAVNQSSQPRTGGTAYVETPEQKEAWRKLRSYMRELNLAAGDTFTVKGTIAKMLLDGTDESPRYFTKKVTDNKGEEKDWPFVKALCAITDPRFGKSGTLDFPAKNVGASFFDGVTSRGKSPNRGGMYNLHVAVTGQEPAQALKDGKGDWDTEDYENKPLLLRLEYQGKEEADSQYADRRLGMKIFIAGFEKDRDVHRAAADLDDEDDAPFPTAIPAGSSAPTAAARSSAATISAPDGPKAVAATQAANLAVTPATVRQVAFIYALGRDAGMDKEQVAEWCDELFGNPPSLITRRDASAFIDALQRRRNEDDNRTEGDYAREADALADPGKDELVSVGVSSGPKKLLADDDTDF